MSHGVLAVILLTLINQQDGLCNDAATDYRIRRPLGTQAQPFPGQGARGGEVRAHLLCGVNPIDAKTRAGLSWAAAQNKDNLPWTPGCRHDVAGCGGKGGGPCVTSLAEGELVCGMVGFPRRRCICRIRGGPRGGAGQARWGEPQAGAALPLAGLTARQGLLEHGGLQSGQRVLILAGAGGVGHLAVQFAAAYGAHVVATASGDNHSFLHSLGASRMVDYHQAGWCTEAITDGPFDLVLDPVGARAARRRWPASSRAAVW